MTPPHDPAYGTAPTGGWTPWGTWEPAAGRPVPAAPAAPAAPAPRPLGPGGIAVVVAGLVIGMVLAAVVGALLLRGAADDAGTAAGEAIGQAMFGGVSEDAGWYADPYAVGGLGPVEQTDPVPPGELGPDPVLDAYAQECFDGDLQSCDDLYMESAPLSDYEEYGSTCGGRVKAWTVPYCTELD
ncbi:hypothetical protein [Geodermatophilus sp. FMUSA9-8]|uniref:hypothetical protein n=1 Tax=Geodermatophilus sp. FMUSA9-8 TaxID=3120155 RepID=UPI003008B32F